MFSCTKQKFIIHLFRAKKRKMKERIIEIMQLLNCSPTQFANAIGVQRTTLQHILNGRNEPSLRFVMAIHDGFPQIDLEWLLYGKGNVFGESSGNDGTKKQDYPLFSGMENALFQTSDKDIPENTNVIEDKSIAHARKRTNSKGVSVDEKGIQDCTSKRIKEVLIFFENGTYQKFLPDLKK